MRSKTCELARFGAVIASSGAFALLILLVLSGPVVGQPFIGDTDRDGDVDIDDMNNVRNNFGASGSPDGGLLGDVGPVDGVVDLNDLKSVEHSFPSGDPIFGPAPASGATVLITSSISGVFSETAAVDVHMSGRRTAWIERGQGTVFALVDYFMEIRDVPRQGALGFGNVHLDLTLDGPGIDSWELLSMAAPELIDHDGDPLTHMRVRFGVFRYWPSSSTLPILFVGQAPTAWMDPSTGGVDFRRTLGQSDPTPIAQAILQIDTEVPFASGTLGQIGKAFSTYNEMGQLGRNDGTLITTDFVLEVREDGVICAIGETEPCDGVVSLDDLNQVRNNFGARGDAAAVSGVLPGDTFPFDGVVDLVDLNRVRNSFRAEPLEAIPEPSSMVLALLAGLAFAGMCFSRARR